MAAALRSCNSGMAAPSGPDDVAAVCVDEAEGRSWSKLMAAYVERKSKRNAMMVVRQNILMKSTKLKKELKYCLAPSWEACQI
jgi:hypothetical protein